LPLPYGNQQSWWQISFAIRPLGTLSASSRAPELWKKYVHEEKSGYMAHHGTVEPPEEESEELNQAQGIRGRERQSSDSSSRTQVGEGFNEASGVRIDPEKGKDKHVIDWYGPEDPQVSLYPQTWMISRC
jgi:hypothetical protein